MRDRSLIPTDTEWRSMLAEVEDLLTALRRLSPAVRAGEQFGERRMMERAADRACISLRQAVAAARHASGDLGSPERCSECKIPKDIATQFGLRPRGWAKSEGRCESCSRRIRRHRVSA